MNGVPAFEIVSLAILPQPVRLDGGAIAAELAIRHGLVELQGCALLLRDDGAFRLMLPKNGRRARVFVISYPARLQMLDAAVAAYRAFAVQPFAPAPLSMESDFVRS